MYCSWGGGPGGRVASTDSYTNLLATLSLLEEEMQDVSGDAPDVEHTEVQAMDGFFDNSPATRPRRMRKQNSSRSQKSTYS